MKTGFSQTNTLLEKDDQRRIHVEYFLPVLPFINVDGVLRDKKGRWDFTQANAVEGTFINEEGLKEKEGSLGFTEAGQQDSPPKV